MKIAVPVGLLATTATCLLVAGFCCKQPAPAANPVLSVAETVSRIPPVSTPVHSRARIEPESNPTRLKTSAAPTLAVGTNIPHETQPNWPLVFRDAGSLHLSPAQQRLFDQLQDDFARQVGERQDPHQPAYRARWLKAQAEADSRLRVAFGSQLTDKLQLQAIREDRGAGQNK